MRRFDHVLEKVETQGATTFVGRVTQVVGMIIEGVLPNATLGASCRLEPPSAPPILASVVGLRDSHAVLMPLSNMQGLTVGTRIVTTTDQPSVRVGPGALGRVLDGLGRPIDGRGDLGDTEPYSMSLRPINPLARAPIEEPLDLGIRAINGLVTSGEGQRLAVVASAGVGKSTLLAMMARHTQADVSVVALIGERGREVQDFVRRNLFLDADDAGHIVVVAATSDEPAAMRLRGAYTATAIAEYFRDRGCRVLLLMDSLTRVIMAQREIGLSVGEPPATRGYPPSAFAVIPHLLERAGRTEKGSVTGIYTTLLETEDIEDPIGDAVRATADGHIVLSRALAEAGQFPAVDITKSISRVMRDVTTDDHQEMAQRCRQLIHDQAAAQELITLGAYRPGTNPNHDRALGLATRLRDYMVQGPDQAVSITTALDELRRLLGLNDEATGSSAYSRVPAGATTPEGARRERAVAYRRNEVSR